MKIIYLATLFFFNLNCFSQVANCNGNCNFDNNNFWVFSKSISDTVYLKISLRNKISEEIEHADRIRISYKNNIHEEFSEPYEIDTKEQNENTKGYIYSLYKIIKPCLLEYEKYFFENNREGIKKLESNDISYYYYRVSLKIIPEKDKN